MGSRQARRSVFGGGGQQWQPLVVASRSPPANCRPIESGHPFSLSQRNKGGKERAFALACRAHSTRERERARERARQAEKEKSLHKSQSSATVIRFNCAPDKSFGAAENRRGNRNCTQRRPLEEQGKSYSTTTTSIGQMQVGLRHAAITQLPVPCRHLELHPKSSGPVS